MSKLDAMRALREARYDERAARVAAPATGSGRSDRPVESGVSGTPGQRCGHRSRDGRACTREHGHAARNHRYS